jgi:spermidine/putrescine-binding protein
MPSPAISPPEPPSADNSLSRRSLLQRGGALALGATALPAVVSACGGGGGSSTATSTASAAVRANLNGQIDAFGFAGETGKESKEMQALVRQSGASFSQTFMNAPTDLLQRARSGKADGTDVLDAPNPFVQRFGEEGGVFQEIDPKSLPNLGNLSPGFAGTNQPWYVDGKLMAVPIVFAKSAVLYDSAQTPAITTWTELGDPKYKGKIGFFGDPLLTFCTASQILGYGPGGETPKDKMSAVGDWVKAIVDNAVNLAPSPGELVNQFVAGEIVAAFGGWSAIANEANAAGATGVKFYLFVKDGDVVTTECWGVGAGADNVEGALGYLNAGLDPKINASINNYLFDPSPVEGAEKYLDPAILQAWPVNDLGSVIKRYPYMVLPPNESDQFVTIDEWNEEWTSITA